MYDSAARAVMCAAYQLKMTAAEGYVWFLPQWLDEHWYDTTQYNEPKDPSQHNDQSGHEKVECTTSQMIEVRHSYIIFF